MGNAAHPQLGRCYASGRHPAAIDTQPRELRTIVYRVCVAGKQNQNVHERAQAKQQGHSSRGAEHGRCTRKQVCLLGAKQVGH